jgi:hypothetical protein
MPLTSLIEGASLLYVTDWLADLIRMTPQPLTRVLTEILSERTGTPVIIGIDADDPVTRPVDRDRHEDSRLASAGLDQCTARTGRLMAEGLIIARTELAWLEQRIPAGACRELKEGTEPAGVILARWGLHREDRRALAVWPAEGDTAIRSSAVLMLSDESAGIAYEELTAEFCELLLRAPATGRAHLR